MGILGKHADHRAARLFQSHGDGSARKTLCQVGGPHLYRFRRVAEFAALDLAIGRAHRPNVFLVSPVQADPCGVCERVYFCVDKSRHLYFPFQSLIAYGQAGPCFREGLIVESDYQTTPEYSFWKQSASRGPKLLRQTSRGYANSTENRGAVFVSAGCPLALLRCHQPSPTANRASVF